MAKSGKAKIFLAIASASLLCWAAREAFSAGRIIAASLLCVPALGFALYGWWSELRDIHANLPELLLMAVIALGISTLTSEGVFWLERGELRDEIVAGIQEMHGRHLTLEQKNAIVEAIRDAPKTAQCRAMVRQEMRQRRDRELCKRLRGCLPNRRMDLRST